MSDPGNRPRPARVVRQPGFTLIELLLVVAITAIASAGVAFALRDHGQVALEREAQRLIAVLEAARVRSRASGLPVTWQAVDGGFVLDGLTPLADTPAAEADADADADAGADDRGSDDRGAGALLAPRMRWLSDGIGVADASRLVLGPEPIIGPQALLLTHGGDRIRVATDGLRPFAIAPTDAVAVAP